MLPSLISPSPLATTTTTTTTSSDSFCHKRCTIVFFVYCITFFLFPAIVALVYVYLSKRYSNSRQNQETRDIEIGQYGHEIILNQNQETRDIEIGQYGHVIILQASDLKPFKYKGDGVCAICLGDLIEGEKCMILTRCQHAFHEACICPWLISNLTCPICRMDLR